jgi:hypothetical protein
LFRAKRGISEFASASPRNFTRNDNFLSPDLTMLLIESVSLSMTTTEIFCGIFFSVIPSNKKFFELFVI